MELKDLRNALFGFNKNDVCEYISQLNAIYEQKEQEQNKEQAEALKELNLKNEELSNAAARLNQENTELQRKNDELQSRINSFERETEELHRRIAQLRVSLVSVLEDFDRQLNISEDKSENPQEEQGNEAQP